MFKVSQDIFLNSSDSNGNHGNTNSTFGSYRGPPSSGNGHFEAAANGNQTLASPTSELVDVQKIKILNFPSSTISLNSDVNFIIKKNDVQGNFEVQVENPLGNTCILPLQIIDADSFGVHIHPVHEGVHKVHIKCNSITLPQSPFIVSVQAEGFQQRPSEARLPIFHSDASKVVWKGTGLQSIILNAKNEFTVDASKAGNNILFVGICGPRGQCDEVSIKHIGQDIYSVTYQVQDPGVYIIVAKWGDEHIPGSPFHLIAANA